MRGFHQVAWDVLERSINWQKSKRCVDMRQGEYYRKRAVKKKTERMMSYVKILQQGVQNAVAAENCLPGIGPHQIAHPEGNDHQLIEQVFALARIKRKIVGERISE